MAGKKDDGLGDRARSAELLWGTRAQPSRGPKPTLRTEQIVEVAIAIADAEGLAAVSMQRLASEFGFTPMSLYRYVPGKGELLELMIDAAAGEVPAIDEVEGDWRAKMEVWADRMRAGFHRHPWLLETTGYLRVMGPNELGWLDAALRAMQSTGLPAWEQHDAFLLVLGHIRSAAQHAVGSANAPRGITSAQWSASVAGVMATHGDRLPALRAAAEAGAFDPANRQGPDFGLRCVLDGIGVLVSERAKRATRATRKKR